MIFQIGLIFLISYFLGSIPFGLILVRLISGKDVRKVESGRTGTTNAGRAAGLWAAIGTALLDGFKAAAAVWIAKWLTPNLYWVHVLAPILAILGHNYSIFLIEKSPDGKIRLRGGAGGASCVGGSLGLWAPSIAIILPVAVLLLYFVGYASVTTMSMALLSIIIFAVRAIWFQAPWEYIFYGIFSELLIIWALRPNIRRLIKGNERLVGRRAKKMKQKQPIQNHSSSSVSSSS